jgi:hypothetical protein
LRCDFVNLLQICCAEFVRKIDFFRRFSGVWGGTINQTECKGFSPYFFRHFPETRKTRFLLNKYNCIKILVTAHPQHAGERYRKPRFVKKNFLPVKFSKKKIGFSPASDLFPEKQSQNIGARKYSFLRTFRRWIKWFYLTDKTEDSARNREISFSRVSGRK